LSHVKSDFDRDREPARNRTQLTAAAVLLAIPVVALLWVGTFAKTEPTFAGFPFFIWYQFLWVFLCSGCTWAAFHLVQIARPHQSSKGGAKDGARGKKRSR
jgi:hypothetical protein